MGNRLIRDNVAAKLGSQALSRAVFKAARSALKGQDHPTKWAILDKLPDRLGGILKSKSLRNDGLDLT